MSIESEIRSRLTAEFQPVQLEVVNDSAKHAGHSGDDGTGESHFKVTIRATALAGLGRVERHRAVQRALGDINTRVHALALDIG